MGFDVLRRVRWRNLGRAVAAVALVAAVVAWPRLTPLEPRVPGSEPRPLVAGPPRVAPETRREERVGRRPTRVVSPPRRPRVRKAKRRPPPAETSRENSPAQTPQVDAAQTPPVDAAPAPQVDPAQTEFGFEGG